VFGKEVWDSLGTPNPDNFFQDKAPDSFGRICGLGHVGDILAQELWELECFGNISGHDETSLGNVWVTFLSTSDVYTMERRTAASYQHMC
jgi:hypothetical protein